jgi:uncharacterized protein YceK
MKTLLLIVTLLASGCATVDHNGDTPREAAVRAWLTEEVYRIHNGRQEVSDRYSKGEITLEEAGILLDQYREEKRTILQRIPYELR